MECRKEQNNDFCNCTASCSSHGVCCTCVSKHAKRGEFPACFFTAKGEALYDRSFKALQKDRMERY